MKIVIEFLAVFCVICASVSMAMDGDDPADPLDQYTTDPLNATYLIEGDQIFEGWVTIGHEVRSFLPCSYKKTLWLMGNSPALDEIMAACGKALTGAMPYKPIFMTLAGRAGKPSADGFGADFEGAFLATRLVRVFPQGNCKSDLIYLDRHCRANVSRRLSGSADMPGVNGFSREIFPSFSGSLTGK